MDYDYDDEMFEEITQQQQQTASTSPINTGSSPDLIYSMMQYYVSIFFSSEFSFTWKCF
jgi:hypothetical protein